jgi:hypothetical protein
MRHRLVFLRASILVVLGAIGCSGASPSSKTAKEVLEGTDQIELYSLDPKDEDRKDFHGWSVLGKVTIRDDETRKRILDALYTSLAEAKGLSPACFEPRHALRATFNGKTIEIFVCFHCLNVEFIMGTKATMEHISNSAEAVFDEVLTSAGVPLAKKGK